MAQVENLTYTIEVDLTNGLVKIDGLTDGFVKASDAARTLKDTVKGVDANLGQTASKAGLAGAAITEMGRTISDSNYGMTAMANNLQQLSTLLVTLVSTMQGPDGKGGVSAAFNLLKTQMMGPLGLIVGFQIIFAVVEKFAMSARTATKQAEQLKNVFDALTVSVYDLADAERERLKVSEKLTNEQAAQLLSGQMQAEAEKLRVENQIDQLEEERKILSLLGKDTSDIDAQIAIRERQISAYEEQLRRLLDLIRNGPKDGSGKRDAIPKAEIHESKGTFLTDLFGDALDVEGLLGESALNAMSTFAENEAVIDAQRTSSARAEADARMAIARTEAQQRIDALGMIGDGVRSFGEMLGEQTEAGKAVAIAGALISTFAAVTKALDTPGLGLARIPYAVSVGAFGLAQVAQIARVNARGARGAGSSSVGGSGETSITPSFNVVGGSRIDQLNDTIRQELGRPQRAYVVNKDVRSAEELERNIVSGASI